MHQRACSRCRRRHTFGVQDEVPSEPSGCTPFRNDTRPSAAERGRGRDRPFRPIIFVPRGGSRERKLNAFSSTARDIHMALLNITPPTTTASFRRRRKFNQAYRKLIPDYLDNEKPFYLPGCAWHRANDMKVPEDIGEPPDYAQALERGENHWAYVSGLAKIRRPPSRLSRMDSRSSLAFMPVAEEKKGGVWGGDRAIVVYVDGSVRYREDPVDPETLRVLRRKGRTQSGHLLAGVGAPIPERSSIPSEDVCL